MIVAPSEQRRSRFHLIRNMVPLVVGALVAVSMTGCAPSFAYAPTSENGGSPVQHADPVPNATDASRLQKLSADPLFSGSSTTPPAPVPGGAGYDLKRGHVVTVRMGGDPNGTVPIGSAQAELERVRTSGWTVVAVECTVDPNFTAATIYAVKSMGSFTAALEDFVFPASHTTAAFAPFHSEGADPWKPNKAVTNTCVDGSAAPTSTTEAVDTNIGENALV
jgi:hypothetical protein